MSHAVSSRIAGVLTRLLVGALAAILIAAAPAVAAAANRSAVTGADVAALKPGEYIWAPALAPRGPLLIVISLSAQRAYVYRNGVRIAAATASTGRKGRETPTGVFTILEKRRFYRSRKYNNAPMPFMQRLTWSGVALHGGPLPGYAASHGCIRLPHAFAAQLFALTSVGATVVITEGAPRPVRLEGIRLLESPATPVDAALIPYTWQPQLAPAGPVSILVSAPDERLVVLRNGKLIGSGQIRLPPGQLTGVEALAFTGFDADGRSQWIYLDVPGQEATKGSSPALLSAAELQIAPAYLALVRSVLTPGATLVATDASLASGDAGQSLMLLESDAR